MGIALNTGEVIVGNIGSQKHIKYGVVGSHVNLTARIESNTVGGQVLISGTTLELAGADVQVGEKQLIVAKGFPEPIPAYEVKGIGGAYNLELEEVDLGLVDARGAARGPLPRDEGQERGGRRAARPARDAVGAGRHAGRRGGGSRRSRTSSSAWSTRPGSWSTAISTPRCWPTGEPTRLRFTAVPPPVERFIAARLAPSTAERSSELAERGG